MTRVFRILTLSFIITMIAACDRDNDGIVIPSTDPAMSFTPGAASEHWTVINYWAVWCAPCREEIPELNALSQAHRGNLRVFGVNYDGASGHKLASAIKELDIKFPVLEIDPQPALGIARPQALPATLVIKPTGALHVVVLGPQTADSLWQIIAKAQ
ncbi:MAG: thiol-disulfide isomerase/thioredoxin [Bermanella sp.]|jgi:thiol-disulfide isomerase/thioredoxin